MTNLIGVVFAVLSTNYHVDFVPKPCSICKQPHHYQANETFVTVGTNWVNVLENGGVSTVELEPISPKTNTVGRIINDPAQFKPSKPLPPRIVTAPAFELHTK